MTGKRILMIFSLANMLFVNAWGAPVSVNLGINLNDANAVDPGETSVVGNPDAMALDGASWNNILLQNTGSSGVPTTFITNTTGGNSITLLDAVGNNAAELTSTIASGGGFSNFADVSSPNQATTGDGGLFQSFLNFGAAVPAETLVVSGLGSEFTDRGYKVVAFFDIGNATRTYGLKVGSQEFWTLDNPTDSDPDNDGVIAWNRTMATTSGTAVTNANYAVFDHLTGASFTLEGVSTGGRTVLSGFQIVPFEGDAVLIDIGTSAGSPAAPDANGNLWNTLNAVGTPLTLIDKTAGTDTGWRLTVANGPSGDGFTGGVVSSTPGPGEFNVQPAYGDGWFDNTSAATSGVFTFSGLDAASTYELLLWGNRETNWDDGNIDVLTGSTLEGSSHTLMQDQLLSLTITPDLTGEFAFTLDKANVSGNNTVLNIMSLQLLNPVPEPMSIVLMAFAAVGLLGCRTLGSRWNIQD